MSEQDGYWYFLEGLAANGKSTTLKNMAINNENVMIISFPENLVADKYEKELNK